MHDEAHIVDHRDAVVALDQMPGFEQWGGHGGPFSVALTVLRPGGFDTATAGLARPPVRAAEKAERAADYASFVRPPDVDGR